MPPNSELLGVDIDEGSSALLGTKLMFTQLGDPNNGRIGTITEVLLKVPDHIGACVSWDTHRVLTPRDQPQGTSFPTVPGIVSSTLVLDASNHVLSPSYKNYAAGDSLAIALNGFAYEAVTVVKRCQHSRYVVETKATHIRYEVDVNQRNTYTPTLVGAHAVSPQPFLPSATHVCCTCVDA